MSEKVLIVQQRRSDARAILLPAMGYALLNTLFIMSEICDPNPPLLMVLRSDIERAIGGGGPLLFGDHAARVREPPFPQQHLGSSRP